MNAFDLSAVLKLDTSQFNTALSSASASSTGFISGLVKSFGVGQLAVAALGAAVGAFFVSSVKTGAEFDKSMSQVAATMGMSMSEMEQSVGSVDLAWGNFSGNLREYAQVMGENTAFSAKECADALNYMALAGYDTQTSMEMLPNVLNLAAAGGMDLARASDMVTDTQTAFGISTERTTQMVDEMAKAASTGNTSVEQLGDAFLVVGGLAQELNGGLVDLSDGTQSSVDGVQELEIALTAMANAGVKGSEAGTHMRNMLLKLSSPTSDGAKQMEALGVSVFDADGKMRSLNDIFGDLNNSLGTLTQEQKIQAISDLFNTRDLASAEALLNAVGQDWDNIGESILNAQGAAQKMAETQLDNLAGDVTLFKSALEGAQIAISDALGPALRTFVQTGTKMISEIASFVKEHSAEITSVLKGVASVISSIFSAVLLPLIETTITVLDKLFTFISENTGLVISAIAAIGAAFVALQFESVAASMSAMITQFIAVFISSLAAGETALGAFGAAFKAVSLVIETNPIGLIVTAVVAAVAAIAGLIYHLATEEEAIKSVNEAEKEYVDAKKKHEDAVKSVFDAEERLIQSQEKLAKLEAEVGQSGEELYNMYMNGAISVGEMTDKQRELFHAYEDTKEAQEKSTQASLESISTMQEENAKFFEQTAAHIKENGDSWLEYKNNVVQAFTDGKISAEQARDLIGGAMSEMSIDARMTFVEDIPNNIKQGLNADNYQTDWQRFTSTWEAVGNLISGNWGGTMERVSEDSVGAFDDTTNTWSPIADWFGDLFGEAWNNITSIFSIVGTWFSDRYNDVVNAFNSVSDWFRDKFQNAWDNLTGIFSAIGQWFEDRWNDIVSVFSGVADWFRGAFQSAKDAVTGVWDNIGDFFSDVWQWIKDALNIDEALTWGSDLIDNFTRGIENGFKNVRDTVTRLAQIIKDFIGFSEPDEGPLSNFHTFAPDMIELFVQGLEDGQPKIQDGVAVLSDNIKHQFDGMMLDAYMVGGNYITSLINGLVAELPKLSSITDSVKGEFDKIKDTIVETTKAVHNLINKLEEYRRAQAVASITSVQSLGRVVTTSVNSTGDARASNSTVNYNFNQVNNSPKALSTIEIYRQTRNQFSQLIATKGVKV